MTNNKTGRNVKYKTSFLTEIPILAIQNRHLTTPILAKAFGCTERTIHLWKNKYPEFKEAINNPLGSVLGQHYEKVVGNMLNGRTIIERDQEGNVTKETTQPPTPQDLMLPKSLGYLRTDDFAKHHAKQRDVKTMQPYRKLYRDGKINLSELLFAYDDEGIEPPPHLVKEHAAALASGELSLIHDDDLYDKEHAERVMQASIQRQQQAKAEREATRAELEATRAELEKLKAELANVDK